MAKKWKSIRFPEFLLRKIVAHQESEKTDFTGAVLDLIQKGLQPPKAKTFIVDCQDLELHCRDQRKDITFHKCLTCKRGTVHSF